MTGSSHRLRGLCSLRFRGTLLPLATGFATLTWTLFLAPRADSQTEDEVRPATKSEAGAPDDLVRASQALAAGRLPEARSLLKALEPNLTTEQRGRWYNLASRAAVRLGDAAWLKDLAKDGGLATSATELQVLLAMRQLLAGQLDETRITLTAIKDWESLADIPRRRYMELWQRLEQLSGHAAPEKVWATRLVSLVSRWDSAECQSCHANPKLYGTQVTSFDLDGWWLGRRYSELLAADGSAAEVAAASRKQLDGTPGDYSARLRLAYALRALNQDKAAEGALRQFDWARYEDRVFKQPLRLATFP